MTPVTATVLSWDDDAGWGVCAAPETPGGCWVHYSVIESTGYRQLREGAQVWLVVEAVPQDGYAFRAVRCWSGAGTDAGTGPPPQEEQDSSAYTSRLELTFDEEPDR